MPNILLCLAFIAALLLAACTSAAPPAPSAPDASAQAPASEAPALPVAKTHAGSEVDFGCSSDEECTVKDVGNCCGYYPACVNTDSPTFPERVKAQCEEEGMSAICGFREIDSCVCNAGRCEAAPQAATVE